MNTFMLDMANFLARLISLYSFFIWIRIFLSWINPFPREGSLTYYFALIVDPFLNLFRSKHFRVGILDLSPIFAIAVLSLVQSLLKLFSIYGTLRLGWVLSLLLQYTWSYGIQIFLMFAIIVMIVRTIAAFTGSLALSRIATLAEPLMKKVREIFFTRRLVKDTTLSVTTLIVIICVYAMLSYIFSLLITYSMRIPF